MKTTSILSAVLASAAVASAQVRYEDGKYICEQENASYCGGGSLGTDIIIRCNGKVGQPGRCTNNLVGQPPVGANPALCWQTSPTSGDAACEKNCVVYAETGTFTLPADVCTPSAINPTSTTVLVNPSASNPTSTITFVNPGTGGPGTSTTALVNPSASNPTSAITFVNPGTGGPGTSTTASSNPGSFVTTKTTALTNPPVSSPTGTGSASGTKTGGQGPVSTAGAAVNKAAMGGLAVLGGVAAFLA